MNLEQVLKTFLDESRDLLQEMERILLELEYGSANPELNNALFRCVHTIKGSAGMFDMPHVVGFTHIVENLLDRMRAGRIELTGPLSQLLLQCRDHISALVELRGAALPPELAADDRKLLAALASYAGEVGGRESRSDDAGVAADIIVTPVWQVSLRFHAQILQHGMDPISFIQYLAKLGDINAVSVLSDRMPPLTDLEPEDCYLGFEIEITTTASRAEIEAVFEFAEGLCDLCLQSPSELAAAGSEPAAPSAVLSNCESELKDIARAAPSTTAAIRPAAAGGEDAVSSSPSAPKASLVPLASDDKTGPRGRRAAQHLRVQAEKLDQLINLVGEMVIASAAVSINATKAGDVATRESAAAMSLLVEEIRDRSLQMRMVPIGDTFARFPRLVRDIASELGKDIELSVEGGETELDKTVVERIADPLTHLVRNACDHGIETLERRRATGKPTRGVIKLDAYHESGAIVIEVSDDGAGLDRARILRKAVERGLIGAEAVLSDDEVANLIFEPGFSTAEQVTNISGRGVGMDVVRRNIEALRGSVDVSSVVGRGTCFRLRLPLTLAIIDGFLSQVGEVTYVVPLDSVDECVEYTAQQHAASGERNILDLRGEVLPLISLRQQFSIKGAPPRRQNVLVVNHGGARAGLLVDELLGEHQTVIKPLGGIFAGVKGLSGSTILGTGKVALILDVAGLLHLALNGEHRFIEATEHQQRISGA